MQLDLGCYLVAQIIRIQGYGTVACHDGHAIVCWRRLEMRDLFWVDLVGGHRGRAFAWNSREATAEMFSQIPTTAEESLVSTRLENEMRCWGFIQVVVHKTPTS